ncbi:MAG: NACHT domain-containing protein [Symploca sp. SIO2D2]|nr:NACHT domain-containing protein [Symploca sp. SIO2D2]
MWELLAATTGVELGKLVLEQVLNLGKSALEDYVKDFFKNSIQSGVTRVKAEELKKPMAEAVGYFIKRFIKELQINDVPDSSINHYYKAAVKKFVQDKAVRPILGEAFGKDCKQINYSELQRLWTQYAQDTKWQFPADEFDWSGVAKEYRFEVKGIIKANPELRSLLETELLEEIAQNTAQISPGFDLAKYRDSLQCSYGYLKLYTLDSTDRVDAIKLWQMFIEQTVREALPPTRYELPLDLQHQLQEEGQLEDLSPEALEYYRREYFQQPPRKVLAAVADVQQAVILGDPGAGKSTLLQYLALDWVEGKTITLPLLIELREYAIAQVKNFLEFLHCGKGADWQFDQKQLNEHLLEHPTLVMFDGLDEVFDRLTQSTIIDEIIRFSQQYPQARVLVTSRIIGYNPERFQQAGFHQFTIQPLDDEEIQEFINRWYDLAMGSDADKELLKQRLKDAIANSQAIQNLADNPLLLTMMAILNRRQELPRDRTDLYDQASRVLLYHWDVDHKRLELPMDAIGRREKQEMLRLIAYEMQAGEEGLKGNLISAERLTVILTDYLRHQGFSEPREKAYRVIKQLRERNFILCYRGADTYGFVHRTFLEYFCAVEIVHKFEKQQTLSFEQLRDEVFGGHWQDETWHEVLQLICGMIDAKFAGELISFLMPLQGDGAQINAFFEPELSGLLLAIDCFIEIKNHSTTTFTGEKLFKFIKKKFDNPLIDRLQHSSVESLAAKLASVWGGDREVLDWLKSSLQYDDLYLPHIILPAITQGWREAPGILSWLKDFIQQDEKRQDKKIAIQEIARVWKDSPDTLPWLKSLIHTHREDEVQKAAVKAIAKGWKNDPDTLPMLKSWVQQEQDSSVRQAAIEALARGWKDNPNTLPMLKSWVQQEQDSFVRSEAIEALAWGWKDDPDTLQMLKSILEQEQDSSVRQAAIKALARGWKDDPDTLQMLKSILEQEQDSSVRSAAIERLVWDWKNDPDILPMLKLILEQEQELPISSIAIVGLAWGWKNNSEVISILKSMLKQQDPYIRKTAIQELADGWKDDSETLTILQTFAQKEDQPLIVRYAAVKKLAINCHHILEVEEILFNIAFKEFPQQEEPDWRNPHIAAIKAICYLYPDNPKTITLLSDRAINDSNEEIREWAKNRLRRSNSLEMHFQANTHPD